MLRDYLLDNDILEWERASLELIERETPSPRTKLNKHLAPAHCAGASETTLFEMLFFSGISSNGIFIPLDFANSASPGARASLGLFVIFLATIAR